MSPLWRHRRQVLERARRGEDSVAIACALLIELRLVLAIIAGEVERLARVGTPARGIAAELHLALDDVRAILDAAPSAAREAARGEAPAPAGRWSDAEIETVIAMWRAGAKTRAIADAVGRSLEGTHNKLSALKDEGRIDARPARGAPPADQKPAASGDGAGAFVNGMGWARADTAAPPPTAIVGPVEAALEVLGARVEGPDRNGLCRLDGRLVGLRAVVIAANAVRAAAGARPIAYPGVAA